MIYTQLPQKNKVTAVISRAADLSLWLLIYAEDKDECYIKITADKAILLSENTGIPITEEYTGKQLNFNEISEA